MTHNEMCLAHAILYSERFGLSVIPMSADKRPTIKWKEYQDRRPTFTEICSWKWDNIAIVTGAVSGLAVIDCDTVALAQWWAANREPTPAVVKTKRGYHFYYKHPGGQVQNGTKIEGRYDVRGDGGYVLCPPATHSNGRYEWATATDGTKKRLIHPSELPAFRPEWRPPTPASAMASNKNIRDGVAYIAKIHARAGQGGHDATYRAVQVLKAAGLTETDAYMALEEWNDTNAEPPWRRNELLHKIKSVYGT